MGESGGNGAGGYVIFKLFTRAKSTVNEREIRILQMRIEIDSDVEKLTS